MKALVIVATLALTLSASSQKSVENPPGVLLHGDAVHGSGQSGTLRVVLTSGDGEPAKHVAVMVLWMCPKGCQIVVSSMLTNSVGEFQLDPISVGKYLVCSNADVDPSHDCLRDVAAASCTVEIAPEFPKVELHMQIPKRDAKQPQEKARCRQTASH